MKSEIRHLKGRITRWLGVATGDREAEARGDALETRGFEPGDAELRDEIRSVKRRHHDYGERLPPQRISHADRRPGTRRSSAG